MKMMEYTPDDAETKYKKKSASKPPKKSKHKHEYVPCVFNIPTEDWSPVHGMVDAKTLVEGTYCRICGKVGERSLWRTTEVYDEETGARLLKLSSKSEMEAAANKLIASGTPVFSLQTKYGLWDKFVKERDEDV